MVRPELYRRGPTEGMEIGIVGASVAGLGVAYGLRGTDIEVTLLEKDREVGGRATTRRENGCELGWRSAESGDESLQVVDPDDGDDRSR